MLDLARSHPDAHRRLLGWIGLLLPVLLVILVCARDGRTLWRNLDSISAYYYSGAVAAFVGMLVSMALFLFTYRGYEGRPYHRADRRVGIIAAIAALGVALFPTGAPTGVSPLSWWEPWIGVAHYGSTIVLFAMFAVYALVLFPLTANGDKVKIRWSGWNAVYPTCGFVILGAMAYAGCARFFSPDVSIFVPESIAMVAFAVSWLFKGKALRDTVVRPVKSWMRPKEIRAAQTSVRKG